MSDPKVSVSQPKNKYYDSVDILSTKKSCYESAVTLLIIKYVRDARPFYRGPLSLCSLKG